MKSLYVKNFIATAALVLFSFTIIGSAFVFLGRSYVISSHRETMERNAEEIVRTVSAYGDLGRWEVRINISSASYITGCHIFLADSAGTVVVCSDDSFCEHLGQSVAPGIVNGIRIAGLMDSITDLGGFYENRQYVVAMPIAREGAETSLGYVFVSSDTGSITGTWLGFMWVFLIVGIAVMLLAMVLSLFNSKRMARPLDEMASAARKFARGDFSVRVTPDYSSDEIAALTTSFNTMADSLERSEELRNEFIANVSHELKTPMTTISGFADGILDGTIPKEQEDKYLATIAEETRRLSRLVRRMLTLSRAKSTGTDLSARKEFDLNELIITTLLSFEVRAEDKNLKVNLQLPEDHMKVFAEPDAITQVLYNLLDNAVKFSSSEGELCVALWKREGKAYVSIKNCGDTIPEEDLPFVFDRFHKSDKSRSRDRDGVGLGLYLVKSILDSHNEDIGITSRDGVTEFMFTLTLA